jgi:predicted DNA-binding transcriptional regulator YafY
MAAAKKEPEKPACGARPPMERMLKIHNQLRRGRPTNAAKLAEQLGVSQKTIQRDISFMRDHLDLPLEYNKFEHRVFYNKAVQDFPMAQATVEDVVALFIARRALEPLQDTPLSAELKQTFRRLTASLQGQITFDWDDLDQVMSVKEPGIELEDFRLFEKIAEAVLKTHVIHFNYKNLNASKTEARQLQPLHLARVDGGWYVIGYDLQRKARRTFALQRISGVQAKKKERFARPRDFELGKHLAGFGIWENTHTDGSKYKIKIRFTSWAAQVVSERRWHPSQEIKAIKKDGAEIEMSLELGDLKDITRWILSWGGQATVLAPRELKTIVKKEVAQMTKNCR